MIVDGLDGADAVTVNNPNPAAGLTNLVVKLGPTAGSTVDVPATPSGVTTTVSGAAAMTVRVGSKAPDLGGITPLGEVEPHPPKHGLAGHVADAGVVGNAEVGSALCKIAKYHCICRSA